MRSYILISFIFGLLLGCGQDYNSNSFDEALYGDNLILASNSLEKRFADAYNLLQTRCFDCHPAWASYTTSQNWIDNAYVIEGNFTTSPLILELNGFGGIMPPGSEPLTIEDITILKDWINNL
jgi:hypothetical protein